MFEIFNTEKTTLFKINNFELNVPLNIKTYNQMFLSCCEILNIVDFYNKDDGSDRQKWIIEKEDDDYYIRCVFKRFNFTQYLGCPNKNNQVYLYTSKNKHTKWSIKHIELDVYKFIYTGEKFDNTKLSLVVARYNEDINWALAYNDIAIVYNKGRNFNLPFTTVKNIENIGREGHTYLYHMINNYENLNEKTIFCQGDPFLHNETILFGIDNYEKTMDVQPLGLQYIKQYEIPPKHILDNHKTKTDYGLEYLICNIDENLEYKNPNFIDMGIKNLIKKYNEKFPKCSSIVGNFLNRSNFPIVKPIDNIRFSFCALFSLKKEKIRKYSPNTYQNILKELISFHNQGGENGYVLERLWLYIFED